MIEGIDHSSFPARMPSLGAGQKLTDAQKESAKEIISNYDSKNLTPDKFRELFDTLKSEGIGAGEDLKGILDEAGFELPKPEDLSNKADISKKSGVFTGNPIFADFAEKFKSGTATEEDLNSLYKYLQSNDLGYTGNILDGEV